jgi:uncharacterized RDD family membrane protein YckC
MRMPEPNLASLGDRFIAHFIDYIIFVLGIGLSVTIIFMAANGYNLFWEIVGVVGRLCLFPVIFYRLCADGLEGGQSYGKRLMKICVIDATSGKPCTFLKSLLRQIPSLLLGIIDIAFIFSQSRQRLGDTIANTIVVNKPPRSNNY